jgi:hypothetical protein
MIKELKDILDFVIFRVGQHEIKTYSLVTVLLIFLITKLLIWLIRKGLFRKRKSGKLDHSNAYSLYQIIRYTPHCSAGWFRCSSGWGWPWSPANV